MTPEEEMQAGVKSMVGLAATVVDEAALKCRVILTPQQRADGIVDFVCRWLAYRPTEAPKIQIDWSGVKL